MKILTSIGLSTSGLMGVLKDINKSNRWKSACIIVSAHIDGALNKYAKLAKKQLKSIGVEDVRYIDFYGQDLDLVKNFDLVYIAGGNTFRLLRSIKHHENGVGRLKGLLSNKDIIGVSAGSIILTPTIRIANEIEPDDYLEVDSFESLGLVSFEIYPHFEKKVSREVSDYEKKYVTRVKKLTNDEYLLIE